MAEPTECESAFRAGCELETASSRYVDWANGSAIGPANLDGINVNQRFITGAHRAVGVAVNARYIDWSNTSTIGRANLVGTGVNQRFIAWPGPSVSWQPHRRSATRHLDRCSLERGAHRRRL